MQTERVLADFEGTWALRRQITHANGTKGCFEGQAVFAPDGSGLAYSETGQLYLGQGTPLSATQRYHWAEGLIVSFADGRFFHQVPPWGGDTAHWCDPDDYRGAYDFADWPAFGVTWRVTGPKKDYVSVSRYCRTATGI